MTPDQCFAIGLRISPNNPEAELLTLWFEDELGKNKVACLEGRIQWASSLSDVSNLEDSTYDLTGVRGRDLAVDGVCSIPLLLYGLTHPDEADERTILLALNLLDDLVSSTGYALQPSMQSTLDRVVARVTEGASVRDAIIRIEANQVVEAVLASLGRVFCFSDFH